MARVESYNGSPAILIDGVPYPPMMATVRTNQFGVVKLDKEYYRRLGESGIRIFFLICDTEWLVPDGFAKFRQEAEALLEAVPDAYIIPRIGLHPPVDWIESHPDDCVQYSDGKDRPVRLITESYTADLPRMYSLCSDAWRKDAGDALERLLDKMDALPYADRIIGYFLAAGGTSEWYYCTDRTLTLDETVCFDHSPAFRKEFARYLDKKYGPGVKAPDIPDAASRYYQFLVDYKVANYGRLLAADPVPPPPSNGTNLGSFLDVDRHMQTADFVYAWSWGVANSIVYFADRIKKRDPEKLVGSFYGALSMFHKAGNALATQEIIRSGKVDFLAAPGSYENRQPGGYTGQREIPDSFRLHNTIFIVEDDTRTHAENSHWADYYGVFDEEDTVNVMKRDFGRNICEDLQSWWFDQHHGGGRYKSEVCYKLIEKQQRIARYAYSLDRRKGNEVACIYDVDSMVISSHQTCTESIKVMKNYELNCTGFPFDQYFLDDIADIPDYKLYIFFNAYSLTDEKRRRIREKLSRNHAAALWMYAPGLIAPDREKKIDPGYMEEVTGIRMGMRNEKYGAKFRLTDMTHPITRPLERGHVYGQLDRPFRMNARSYQEHDTPSYLYPLIYADDERATVLGRFCGTGLPAFVLRDCGDYTSIFCGTKLLQSEVLRSIAHFAGCHVYSEENDVLYANRHFITLHAARAGRKQIRLRESCYPYELYEERFYDAGNGISLEMAEGETKMFALLPEKKAPDLV